MTEDYWKEIAETNDTLVFYMSVGNLTNWWINLKNMMCLRKRKLP